MNVSAALFVSAVLVACFVDLANGEPQKQDSGSDASVQVGDYVLSIARAKATCSGAVLDTVCATNPAGDQHCQNFGGGGIYCSGTCVNGKPCCKKCPSG